MALTDRTSINPSKLMFIAVISAIVTLFGCSLNFTYCGAVYSERFKFYNSFVHDYETINNNTITNSSTYCINPIANKDIADIYISSDDVYILNFYSKGLTIAIVPILSDGSLIVNVTQVYRNISGCINIIWSNNNSVNDLSYEITFQNTGSPSEPDSQWVIISLMIMFLAPIIVYASVYLVIRAIVER